MKRLVIGVLVLTLGTGVTAMAADPVGEALKTARASLDAGKVDAAVDLLEKIRRTHPEDPRPVPLLAYTLFTKKGDVRRPAYLLMDYLEHQWGDSYSRGLLDHIALAALDGGRPRLAREALGFLVRSGAEDAATLYQWAKATWKMGDRKGARDALRRVIDRTPGNPDPYRLLAVVFLDGGRYEKAADTYRNMLVQWPGDVGLRLNLANLLLWDLRDYRAAQKEFGLALGIAHPASPEAREAMRGIATAKEKAAVSTRLRHRNSLLFWLIVAVMGTFCAVFVAGVYVTRPRSGGTSVGNISAL